MVEHLLAKEGVAGSNPVFRSIFIWMAAQRPVYVRVMPYDEDLAFRIRQILASVNGLREQRMFGGVAFMLNGNMCCGVTGADLMVRVGPEQYENALAEPYARPMDFTGRHMKGLVYVGPEGLQAESALALWVGRGADFAASLPSKPPGRARPQPGAKGRAPRPK